MLGILGSLPAAARVYPDVGCVGNVGIFGFPPSGL